VKLKQMREKRGLTQEVLAKRAGLHRVYLAKIESGNRTPSLALLERIAKVLRVKAGTLLD
jgi:transcriptional regulator with XRE-family HTH domain